MSALPPSIQRAIEAFSRLPGIGPKSAERLAFYLLRKPDEEVRQIGQHIAQLKQGIGYCQTCRHLTMQALCAICEDVERDPSVICVVESPLDLLALEKANSYKGSYHVLHGVISPMDGVGPDELAIAELLDRLRRGGVRELVFALNPSMEGEATSAYILRSLPAEDTPKVTRIAWGIPVGGHLEYADSQTLRRAFEGRSSY